MCGIAGIIEENGKEDIEKMTQAILHRGPDQDGFFVDEHVALGMRRLSIIDLSKGKQPITSADGRYMIFFNGEIYNYKELKKDLTGYKFKTDSDTEVILAGYLKWGKDVLKRLRGMFTICIYDKTDNKIFLARDFFGIKPLYFWQKDGRIVAFSSEIKSFLVLEDFKKEVNDKAVFNYLSYQYNPLPETFFKNVFKLPPAHFMNIDVKSGKVELERYWQFRFRQNESLKEKFAAQKVQDVMKDSVAHHMIADVPVGSFLSGGIDSSIIATLMQKIRGNNKIKTFTVGFETLSEGKEAKETSEPLGTDHKEITVGPDKYFKSLEDVVWHFDEPVADPSAVGIYFLAEEAAKSVKVVLSGEGSDELFGGYNIYLEPFARRWISWIPKVVLKFLSTLPLRGSNFAKRAQMALEDRYIGNASIFSDEEVKKLWQGNNSKIVLNNLYKEVEGLSDSTKMQYIDVNTWLVGDILAKADKMTMAHSLELRVPFLDIEVANLTSSLPDKLKWRGGTTKCILRKAFNGILPASVQNRKKLGFPTPIRDWLTSERKDLYKTILDNAYIKEHMDTEYVSKIIQDHTSKKADNSRKIYLLLMLSLWYNKFIRTP